MYWCPFLFVAAASTYCTYSYLYYEFSYLLNFHFAFTFLILLFTFSFSFFFPDFPFHFTPFPAIPHHDQLGMLFFLQPTNQPFPRGARLCPCSCRCAHMSLSRSPIPAASRHLSALHTYPRPSISTLPAQHPPPAPHQHNTHNFTSDALF